MTPAPYCVIIIVDPLFNGDLSGLLERAPIWIADTPHNRQLAQTAWDSNPTQSHLDGLTIFTVRQERTPADWLIGNFDTIDLHHGVYSADPPFTILEVFGTPISDSIQSLLGEYGFDTLEPSQLGFRAIRPLPTGIDVL